MKFTELTKFTDLVETVGNLTTPGIKTKEMTIHKIREQVKAHVKRNNLQSLVIGISGGLDSAVVAAICQEKYTGVPLIGISIPMHSSPEHIERSQWIGDNFCTSFSTFYGWDESFDMVDGKEMYNDAHEDIFYRLEGTDQVAVKAGFKIKDFPKNILQGNMKARLRMMTLYDLARKTRGIVLSTDNLSELLMGFWTINGDVGDYGPIQNVGKGFELPEIAKYLKIREDIINQPPSDGLMVTEDNTDEAQLGANYKEVDTVMSIYLETLPISETDKKGLKSQLFKLISEDDHAARVVSNVISRYENTHFKRIGTVNLTREQIGL